MDEKGAPAPATAPSGPPAGTPHQVGPYAVNGRWFHDGTGQVLSARDASGRDVEIVLLAPGPAGDPAARDRFGAAAERVGREHPGRLVAAGSDDGLTWAALASGSGPALARPLLDSVQAPGAHAGTGPDFAPHWSGSLAAYPPPPAPAQAPAPATPSRRVWRWVVAALVLALVLLLLLAACWPTGQQGREPGPSTTTTGSPAPQPTPSPSGTESGPGSGPSGPSGSPAPSDSAAGEPVPEQPLATGPGLGGEQFGADEPTTELRLAGLPFPFRVPQGWQCVRSTEEIATVLYLCMDFDAVARAPQESHASGVVELTRCDDVCDQREWAALRSVRSEDDGYRLVDATTLLSEDEDPYEPGFQRIRMSRVFDPDGGQEPRLHVYVDFTSPPQTYAEVRRVVEDIRVNTG